MNLLYFKIYIYIYIYILIHLKIHTLFFPLLYLKKFKYFMKINLINNIKIIIIYKVIYN